MPKIFSSPLVFVFAKYITFIIHEKMEKRKEEREKRKKEKKEGGNKKRKLEGFYSCLLCKLERGRNGTAELTSNALLANARKKPSSSIQNSSKILPPSSSSLILSSTFLVSLASVVKAFIKPYFVCSVKYARSSLSCSSVNLSLIHI